MCLSKCASSMNHSLQITKTDSKGYWSPQFPFFLRLQKADFPTSSHVAVALSSHFTIWGNVRVVLEPYLHSNCIMEIQRQLEPSHIRNVKDLFKKSHAVKWCNRGSITFSALWDEAQHKWNNKVFSWGCHSYPLDKKRDRKIMPEGRIIVEFLSKADKIL